jgi:hypothetical protein
LAKDGVERLRHVILAAANSNPSAITTALIALGGALLGAAIAASTQWLIARKQSQREDAAHKKQVVIAARMMAVDLSRAESSLRYLIDHGEWWPTTGLSARMDPGDRRLVIGELSAQGFYEIDRAEGAIDYWYGIREYEVARNQTYVSATPAANAKKLEKIIGWIDEARRALRRVTGDPESIEDAPKSWPCKLDPGPARLPFPS